MARRAIEVYVTEQLSRNIKRAIKNTSFYKQRIKKPFKWEQVPTMNHIDLRQEGPSMVTVSQSLIERVVTLETSGTTGLPKRIYNTGKDLEATILYFQLGMGSFTSIEEKVFICLPAQRDYSIGKLLEEAMRRNGNETFTFGVVTDLEAALKCIQNERPEVIVGIPAQILALSKLASARGVKIDFIRKVLLSTDHGANALVSTIEGLWHCEVFQYYGMTETGFAGGIECGVHEGYHLYESEILVEIISPLTGEVLPKGQLGEVVITTLAREGMPLMRYRTGDLACIIQEDCSCGSVLNRLSPIWSRIDSVIKLKSGQILVKAMIDEQLWDLASILDFSITLKRGIIQDELCLKIILFEGSFPKSEIRDRLMAIQPVADAVSSGLLELVIDLVGWDGLYCPPPNKRIIQIV